MGQPEKDAIMEALLWTAEAQALVLSTTYSPDFSKEQLQSFRDADTRVLAVHSTIILTLLKELNNG